MKVLQEPPERLVTEDRPVLLSWILGAMIVGAAAITRWLLAEGGWTGPWSSLAPVGFGVVFVVRVQATFDRPAGLVAIETASIRHRSHENHPGRIDPTAPVGQRLRRVCKSFQRPMA